jgi:hypothetical protein
MATMNVYVIESAGGMCKIGRATNPAQRMRDLSTGHPYTLTLPHVFEVGEKASVVECSAHFALAEKRMTGEWFSVSADEAARVIRNIISPPTSSLSASIVMSSWRHGVLLHAIEAANEQIAYALAALQAGALTDHDITAMRAMALAYVDSLDLEDA